MRKIRFKDFTKISIFGMSKGIFEKVKTDMIALVWLIVLGVLTLIIIYLLLKGV